MSIQKTIDRLFRQATITAIFFMIIQTLCAQEKQLVIGQQPVYKVAKATGPITVDGKMDEAAWDKAQVVTFDHFFRTDKPADKQKTKFRMLWDSTSLYLFY
ncbi:MAG TPA: sugar-binding protein, partial [Flavisolibacter sp.]|nr:sugar-binding protein [Flavisolibacter sp.]